MITIRMLFVEIYFFPKIWNSRSGKYTIWGVVGVRAAVLKRHAVDYFSTDQKVI
ncbi:MAG: hypothetical protein P4L47_03660 [Mucilaginibacter sp.]|nr:hypothetical protein [Mucilaginibacter sp.]